MIEPKVLKGFRDSLPGEELARRKIINDIEAALRKFGYVPIDTPALEYKEVLTGKGGQETDKQIFLFKDAGERDVGLRFDLTVPLARFVAANEQQLTFPFKRYHIAKVWRGEKPQRGRYREFYQADFDIVGADSLASDVEIITLVIELLNGLGIRNFKVHVNDRQLIRSILEREGIAELETSILHSIDRIYKVGAAEVKRQLTETIGVEKTEAISFLLEPCEDPKQFFAHLNQRYGLADSRVEGLITIFERRGLASLIKYDPAITRGLDYYTGIVYETFLDDARSLGSVSSGGRYANLTALFSKNNHSAIGGSIGLDRLLAYFAEKNLLSVEQFFSDVIIINFSDNDLASYSEMATALRVRGLSVEIYPEPSKLKKQFSYADAKKIRFAILMGEDEIRSGTFKVKNLTTREEKSYKTLEDFLTDMHLGEGRI